jgi:DNA polymerase III epsilon subunit-like protein
MAGKDVDLLTDTRQVLCSLQRAMWFFGEANCVPPKDFKLASLCQYFGVPFHAANAHEALAVDGI